MQTASNYKKILISAGEASGDMHGAELVQKVHELDPTIKFYGMGGINMQTAGVNLIVNSRELAVIGIFDVITHFPKIRTAMKIMWRAARIDKPDLLILIDYSGFNLRLAKIAKQSGIKVFYFVSPQIWASRQYRIAAIKKYIDVMAVILPFEVEFYRRHNITAHFVGNPLVNKAQPTMAKDVAMNQFGLEPNFKIVGLFPGSRLSEIERMLPIILKSAQLIKQKIPTVQFVMPLASSLTMNDINPYLTKFDLAIKIVSGFNYDVMNVCDAIIAVSGTVTLEIALIGRPLVIIYKTFPPYFPIKLVVKIPHIGLCNIVAGKEIAKELLQQHANPKNISAEIIHILTDEAYRTNMVKELGNVKAKLTSEQQEDVAQLVLNTL